MDCVVGRTVALREPRVVALDDAPFVFSHGIEVGAVQPKVIERCAKVGEESPRMGCVQFTHCRRKKRDVAE